MSIAPCTARPRPAGLHKHHATIASLAPPTHPCWPRSASIRLHSEFVCHALCSRAAVSVPVWLAAVAVSLALHPTAARAETFAVQGRVSEEDAVIRSFPDSLSASDEPESPRVPGGIGRLMEGRGGREIQACTRKCVATCVRGGEGAPGLGPLSARWDPVVFKEGFRSRSYCVSECAQVCAIEAGEGGPLRQAGP